MAVFGRGFGFLGGFGGVD